jgi:hypothetical protein
MGARRKRWRHIAAMRGPGLSCRRRAAGVHVSAWTALARLLDGAARQTAARRRRYKTDQLLGLRSKTFFWQYKYTKCSWMYRGCELNKKHKHRKYILCCWTKSQLRNSTRTMHIIKPSGCACIASPARYFKIIVKYLI